MLSVEDKEILEKFTQHVRSGTDHKAAFLGGYLVGLVLKLDKENDDLREELLLGREKGPTVFADGRSMVYEPNHPVVAVGTPSAGDPNSPLAN